MLLESLLDKSIIYVTGKGGVGKSACTAAVGDALARAGRSVLVVETDVYSAMVEMLGVSQKGVKEVRVRENFWVVNLSASECLVSTLTRFLPSERVVRAITTNRVAEAFFDSAPSVSEFVLLDHIQLLSEGVDRKYDHIIVDLPASGHALTFLSVPDTLYGMMRGVGPIAKRAGLIRDRISNPDHTAIIAVCLPEEMPVNETIELAENMDFRLGRGLDLALVNMVHESPIDEPTRGAFEALRARLGDDTEPAEVLAEDEVDSVTRLVAGNALALDWADRDRRYLAILAERVDAEIVEIPMFYEIEDNALIQRISDHLCTDPDSSADLAS